MHHGLSINAVKVSLTFILHILQHCLQNTLPDVGVHQTTLSLSSGILNSADVS